MAIATSHVPVLMTRGHRWKGGATEMNDEPIRDGESAPARSYEERLREVWAWPGVPLHYGAVFVTATLLPSAGVLLRVEIPPSVAGLLPALAGAVVVVVWWIRKFGRRGPSFSAVMGPGLRARDWKLVLIAECGAWFATVGVELLLLLHNVVIPQGITESSPYVRLRGGLPIACIFLRSVVVAPVVEELLFRGALFRRWRLRFGPVAAALASSVVFGSLHSTPIDNAVRGLVMVLLYVRTKSLWAPIAAHAITNGIGFLLRVVDVRALLAAYHESQVVAVVGLATAAGMVALIGFVLGSWSHLGAALPPDSGGSAPAEALPTPAARSASTR